MVLKTIPGELLIWTNRFASHPEKGWNSVKLAQPVSCVSPPLTTELPHPAGVWDAAVPLESLKSAVQPGPGNKGEKTTPKKHSFKWRHEPILKGCSWVYVMFGCVLYVAALLSSNLPVSDVFCWESSSSSDSDPRSRSLPPFSMLLLELSAEVWETPNLEVGDNGEKLRRDKRFNRQKTEMLGVPNNAVREPKHLMRFTLFWI